MPAPNPESGGIDPAWRYGLAAGRGADIHRAERTRIVCDIQLIGLGGAVIRHGQRAGAVKTDNHQIRIQQRACAVDLDGAGGIRALAEKGIAVVAAEDNAANLSAVGDVQKTGAEKADGQAAGVEQRPSTRGH